MYREDIKFTRLAIEQARKSVAHGGFPAGAVIIQNGQIIGTGMSRGNKLNDPTSHGEMAAIQNACKTLRAAELDAAVLYSSLQPCLMCFGAAMWGRIGQIVFACANDKVSPEYYGGDYHISDINERLSQQIKLTHLPELEPESLSVIHAWEAASAKK